MAKRIIPTLLLYEGRLVKGRQFRAWRTVGHPVQAAKIFNLREVDELVIFDISPSRRVVGPDLATVDAISRVNFVPLTVGGGVRSVDDARALLRRGADKIALGHSGRGVERAIAESFGRQSVVRVCSGPLNLDGDHFGELIVQSRERDGMMCGYDLERLQQAVRGATVPVVASSGCAGFESMDAALGVGADAVAAGALWAFTSATPKEAKIYLAERGWEMRLE